MLRFRRPDLIQLYCFDKRGKLIRESMTTIGIKKGEENENEKNFKRNKRIFTFNVLT